MKTRAIINTAPIITGKSRVFNAFTISFPKPFQPKINSTKTAPANIEANQPEIAVITGFNAFLIFGHVIQCIPIYDIFSSGCAIL